MNSNNLAKNTNMVYTQSTNKRVMKETTDGFSLRINGRGFADKWAWLCDLYLVS